MVRNKLFNKKRDIFFVRGFQRSGTNWVCNLLNLHPNINCTGEFHFGKLYETKQSIQQRQYGLIAKKPRIFNEQFEMFVESTIKEYCGKFSYCGDRTPESISSVIIPNKKYILIQRDGRDCIVSWAYHLLRTNFKLNSNLHKRRDIFKTDQLYFESNKNELLPNNFVRQMAKKWNKRILEDKKTQELVQNRNLKIFLYTIKYENLLNDTDKIRNELYKFIGAKQKLAKKLDSLTQPSFNNINTNSHYRAGKSGRWIEYFTNRQIEIFEKEASEAIDYLKYERYYQYI